MMKILMKFLLVLPLIVAVGCAATINKAVEKDKEISASVTMAADAYWQTKDCKSGLAQAVIDAGNPSRDSRFLLEKLVTLGNKQNPDFQKCYGTAIYTYTLYYVGRDVGQDMMGTVMKILTQWAPGVLP